MLFANVILNFNLDLLETVCGDYNRFIKQSIGLESRNFRPKIKNFV